MEIRFVSITAFRTALDALSKAHQVVVHDITDNLKEIKPEEESQTDR